MGHGDKWLDFSGFSLDPADAKRNGAHGVSIYLAEPIQATAWKRRSPQYFQACLAAGLDVRLNFEWYEGRMMEGYGAGHHDGGSALAQAEAMGYTRGADIVFSHDTGQRNDAAVAEYLRGAQDALGGAYLADIYSGVGTVEAMVAAGRSRRPWQTRAWSNGQTSPHAVLYQNGAQWYGGQVDENVRMTDGPMGSHREPAGGHAPASTPPATPVPAPAGGRVYTVRQGDNLTAIAHRYPEEYVTAASIASLNGLADANRIYPGEVLRIPTQGAPAAPAPAPAAPAPSLRTYTVRSGDNLTAIAHRYPQADVTAASIAALNGLADPNRIYPGQVLRIPN